MYALSCTTKFLKKCEIKRYCLNKLFEFKLVILEIKIMKYIFGKSTSFP